jgi:acyl carrier protein
MNTNKVIEIINEICQEKGYNKIDISKDVNGFLLREDLGFDSFGLALLTVEIENEFEIDIFENGIIESVGEIIDILNNSKS